MSDVSRPLTRFLALWLPRLPTDRLHRLRAGPSWRSATRPEAPLALVATIRNACRLVAVDEAASGAGLTPGLGLTDARARVPALEAVDAEPERDAALLERLADWADRYTPLVMLSDADGLVLDITGAAHLFGGEAAMLADCRNRLMARGFAVRAGLADTIGAAWAVARYARHGADPIVPPGGLAEALGPLPLAALRLEAETVAAFERVGLKTIGQLYDSPRAPIAARFGAPAMTLLDQALGRAGEAFLPRREPPLLVAERRFAEPITDEDMVRRVLASLAGQLATSLDVRGEGLRIAELSLFHADGGVDRVRVGASRPLKSPRGMLDLFAERLKGLGAEIDAGFGFDLVRLSALVTERAGAEQISLSGEGAADEDLAQLVDRLGARLGSDRVVRVAPEDSHCPEQAMRAVPAATAGNAALAWCEEAAPHADHPPDRPLRLFERPEPIETLAQVPDGPPVRFRWRRTLHEVARAEGPERIATSWWTGAQAMTRDYFRIEDVAGRRFWVFRDGLYGRETTAPRWYVHGFFA